MSNSKPNIEKEKCSKELKSLIKEITKEFKDYQGLENSAKYLKHISKKMDDTGNYFYVHI